MEIISFDSLESTQQYLADAIKSGELKSPVAIIANEQTSGIGSRGNSWSDGCGNLFFSFALPCDLLPEDLPLVSASLYFGYIMKETLEFLSSDVWMKWPNDLYVSGDKIGGVITQKIEKNIICGIGVNLHPSKDGHKGIGVYIDKSIIVKNFFSRLKKFPTWKHIFRNYEIEFDKNRDFIVHIDNYQKSLSGAILCEDGSVIIDGKKVYGLR